MSTNAPAQSVFPRWRGFNLLNMFLPDSQGDWQEDDFRWLQDWGFDFVRLPLCYTLWTREGDPLQIEEAGLVKLDRAIELGQRYGLHVSVNLHRAPGYCVNSKLGEPFDLWKDQEALDAFCLHWTTLAKRYQGISSDQVSFDLVNEPLPPSAEGMTREDHERVVRVTVKAIREVSPERQVVIDGLAWGTLPCPELVDLGVGQSCRAYAPNAVSHHRAHWIHGAMEWPEPVWPEVESRGERWNRNRLEQHYAPWAALARQGVGVHCGEGGFYKFTPPAVGLAWLRDCLEILTRHNIGWALWNLRGPFGILDSDRPGTAYEDWHGHKLDRRMLELLQEF